jgi:ribosomal protein S10
MHGKDKKWENWKGRDHLRHVGIDISIILKWI